jgi:hypothetical protein
MAVETGDVTPPTPPTPPTPFLPEPERAPWPKPAQPLPPPPRSSRAGSSWLWYVSLAVAIVVTLGGLGLLYQDDVSWQRQAADLARQNSSLHAQLLTSQSDYKTAQQTIQDLKTQALHPSLGIWNVKQTINGPDYFLAGGVPDTFTYHLNATATGPFSVSILTFVQFAAAIDCVHNGTGPTNYCMHHSGTANTWINVTSVSYDFHLAEGCADYLAVFTAPAPVTLSPNVSVTYNPAQTFTGDCAANS